MQNDRVLWRSNVQKRLHSIYNGVIREESPQNIFMALLTDRLASEFYNSVCFAVDIWYLFERKSSYTQRRFISSEEISDPYARVALSIVIQAISDSRSGRPCDAHGWRLDCPPGDGTHCTPTVHICSTEATKFLKETAHIWESFLHMSDGTVARLLPKKNGSEKSRSEQIISCIFQVSVKPPEVASYP